MDKVYKHLEVERKWYKLWEEKGYFTPRPARGKLPFSILLPLPNANDPLHMGHAMFVVQDILTRYHRMKGDPTLWLPGGDHAGIETQYVFEKRLAKEGKSRLDFDRETLYRMISAFVEENKNINRDQMKRLGFSLDWTRYHYSLEPEIVSIVIDTFRKLHVDGLIYRDDRLVNYCTKCGTSYSDLEIKYIEQKDPLFYMRYGPFTIATVRPESKFRDTALAVNPKDNRYKKYIGQTFDIKGLLGIVKMTIIPDESVDPKFGTGIMKVTPAHDPHDFELGKKFNLPVTPIIDFKGRMDFSWFLERKDADSKHIERAKKYHGQKVITARKMMVEDLKEEGLLIKTDEKYVHRIGTCYKCGTVIEPLPLPQWYVKMKPLAESAIKAVRSGKIKVIPKKRFEKMYFDWMNNILDWNISRQIVWGPRIPVWYAVEKNPNMSVTFIDKNGKKMSGKISELLGRNFDLEEIKAGLQQLMAPPPADYVVDTKEPGKNYIQETDTFDTWFLSGQWPLTTLGFPDSTDFKYFYPTSVMDTMWDILFFWVARMVMLGIYRTHDVPFRVVHLHSRVVDAHGQKMSKSKGNVMNPIEIVDKYGADSLRFALMFGAAPGSDIALSDDKVRGMRNFSNKLWNIGRFIKMNIDTFKQQNISVPEFDPMHPRQKLSGQDKRILTEVGMLGRVVTQNIEKYRFDKAAERLYDFIWHSFADKHIEKSKKALQNNDSQTLSVMIYAYTICLTLLHPFMPFITEEIVSQISLSKRDPLIISPWPKV
ncbi:valine--tRNA ligase [Candidatus Gottesmanbacteria bacterium]|nr:valine--tRNA ligase [Candidatus Gottesmanbacteria bacterium]